MWDTGAWRRCYVLPDHDPTAVPSPCTFEANSRSPAAGGGHGEGTPSLQAPPRFAVTDQQIAGLQRVLAKASRSTLLLLDNQTPWSLRLANSHCDSGSFPGNAKPVPRIRPNELVMCGSISAWVGDAEGNFRYDVEESSESAAGPDDQIVVKWKNPMVDDLLSDRGKWAHVILRGSQLDACWALADGTLHCKSAGSPDEHPRPTQEPNNMLKVTITMRGQTSAPWNATAAEQTFAENARDIPRQIGSEPEPEPEPAHGSGAMAAAAVAPSPWISVGAHDAGIKGEKLGPEYKTEAEVRRAFKRGSHLGYYQANGALSWALASLNVGRLW